MEQDNMKDDNTQHKEEKDIEIIHDSIAYPLDMPPHHEQEAVVQPNSNSDRSSWDENLSDLNNDDEAEDVGENDGQRKNYRDVVSDQTLSEKDERDDEGDDNEEENDESFNAEDPEEINPAYDHIHHQSPSTLIQQHQAGSQHQETPQGEDYDNSNHFTLDQIPLVDYPNSANDIQTSSSLRTGVITASVGKASHDEGKINQQIRHAQNPKQKTHSVIHSHASRNSSSFPESYDVAASFLKKLLNSYYIQKLHQKKSTQDVKSIGVSVGQQSEDRGSQCKEKVDNSSSASTNSSVNEDQSGQSLNKTKSKKHRKGVAFSGFLLAILCILSSCFINELFKMQEELNLKKAELSESLKLNSDYLEKNRQLELKNGMLKKLAEKAVEEEKRNCDFFDIFSILKSTLGSKRQHNIQELCSHYQRYQQLEAHLTQIIETQSENTEDLSKESSLKSSSNHKESVNDQSDSLTPQERTCEGELCSQQQVEAQAQEQAAKKSIFQRIVSVIGAVGKQSVQKEDSGIEPQINAAE